MNEEDTQDVDRLYNHHLLQGHFEMLDESPEEEALAEMTLAETALTEAKTKKGTEKTLLLGKALILYAKALTLYDKCTITDEEGLLCFLCIRYPDLELDWRMLQKLLVLVKTGNIEYQDQKTLEVAILLYTRAVIEKIKGLTGEETNK